MILCDTNILIEFYKNNPTIKAQLEQIGRINLAVSDPTIGELYYGALNKNELRQIQKHLALLHRFPLTTAISRRFLDLMAAYALSHTLSLADALIAATALEHDLPLYTLNLKDFRFIPELKLHIP